MNLDLHSVILSILFEKNSDTIDDRLSQLCVRSVEMCVICANISSFGLSATTISEEKIT